jgi:uncharacterized CHY-type Zn-finger protein
MKQCFKCNQTLPLSEFKVNTKFNLPSDKGTVKVCKTCDFMQTLRTLSNIRWNGTTYTVNRFNNQCEVVEWYKQNEPI